MKSQMFHITYLDTKFDDEGRQWVFTDIVFDAVVTEKFVMHERVAVEQWSEVKLISIQCDAEQQDRDGNTIQVHQIDGEYDRQAFPMSQISDALERHAIDNFDPLGEYDG